MKTRAVLASIGIAALSALLFLLEESWIIASVRFLSLGSAVLVVTILLWIPTVLIVRISQSIAMPLIIQQWQERKRKAAEDAYVKAIEYGFWIVTVKIALVISPSTSAFLMYLKGYRGIRLQITNLVLCFLVSAVWCLIYAEAWRLAWKVWGV